MKEKLNGRWSCGNKGASVQVVGYCRDMSVVLREKGGTERECVGIALSMVGWLVEVSAEG